MAAANAIRQAGVSLRGDLVLTMVPGEIDQEPVDEFTDPQYLSVVPTARTGAPPSRWIRSSELPLVCGLGPGHGMIGDRLGR
jgi:hypothetical protein